MNYTNLHEKAAVLIAQILETDEICAIQVKIGWNLR
jgi:hypothetical protein